uniref:Uncharacterized protein n=1 Tax=Meloidogyne enterolobii TaxID=390850 RepID=A0A6V7V4P4_MELEN|nr:unnamed protein product [Meloidogyne enterolobii]
MRDKIARDFVSSFSIIFSVARRARFLCNRSINKLKKNLFYLFIRFLIYLFIQKCDKVVFFIVYLGVGAWIGVIGSTFLVARIFGEIKCPVPVIHLSEINLPEMHLPEFLPQRGQNSPPPQQQRIRNLHTGNIVTDPYELLELGMQPSGPQYQHHGYYNQQHRHRREINQKECRFNEFGKKNISFPISFHKADKKNSIFNLTKNGCFDNLKNENKIRKKRDIVEVVWKECGGFIVGVWFILALIGRIVGAVLLGIYFWH